MDCTLRLLKQWRIGDSQKRYETVSFYSCSPIVYVKHGLKYAITICPYTGSNFMALDFIINQQIRQQISIPPPKLYEIFFSLKDSQKEGYN